jgi:Cysteine dioxygenase type I.
MLIEKLHELFASDEVNVEEVQHAMESYQSNYQEWKKYANYDAHRYKTTVSFVSSCSIFLPIFVVRNLSVSNYY